MRKERPVVWILLMCLFGLAACSVENRAQAVETSDGEENKPVRKHENMPVVLELFTSQGCSSCPPADAVLSKLGHEPGLKGRIVPLAYHVDYWNYIGWSDPFSSADWTARQRAYGRVLDQDSIYTPQLVIGGASHLNGADEARIRRAVDDVSGDSEANLVLTVDRTAAGRVTADVKAGMLADRKGPQLVVYVVLFENGVTTQVRRGENGGRTLTNDYIVRRLDEAFRIEPRSGSNGQGRIVFELDPSWKGGNLGVAAFLQDPSTMRIHAAAVE